MKLLMTADSVGGVWTYALQLARALAPHGVTVELATMGRPLSARQQQEAAAVPGLRVWVSNFKLEWMDDPWDDVRRAGEWLLELEQETRPDLIHLNNYCHGALPWRAPVLLAGHSCVLSWWEAVRREPAPPSWEHYRAEVARGLRAADLVVAPSAAMLAALQEHYGPRLHSSVIYNARDIGPAPVTAKEPFILAVGRIWDEGKNIAALCHAAPALPWPVLVAGEAQHPDGGCAALGGVQPLGY